MAFRCLIRGAWILALGFLAPSALGQFLVAPYLNLGTSPDTGSLYRRTLALVWHTDLAQGNWEVRYRSGSGPERVFRPSSSEIRTGIAPHRLWSATLQNMEAGQRVEYRVIFRGREVFRSAFRAPANSNQGFRALIVGDIGRGTPGQMRIARRMNLANPDLVVVPGDIVYPHGRMREYRKFFFPVYNSAEVPLLRRSLWVAAPGNHDTAYRSPRRFPDGLAYYRYWLQPRNGPAGPRRTDFANFSFRYGNTYWIVLDSNPYLNWNRAPYRTWLESELRASQNATWRFVVFHQPPFHSSNMKRDEQYMRSIAPLLTRYNVDVVWNGHVHNYQRSHPIRARSRTDWDIDKSFDGLRNVRPRGTIYIVTGAGGAELYDQRLASRPAAWQPYTAAYKAGHSFTVMDVNGRRLQIRQISARGEELDRIRIEK